MIDFSKQLFRCSRLGDIMTNIDSYELTKGHFTFLKKLHREIKYSRVPQIKSKYLEKGIAMEEDAITLLARVKGIMLKKNEETIANSFLSGTPDIFIGESIRKAEKGFDTKCSWSLDTFPFPGDKLDAGYYFQDMGYIALTGAKSWVTAFCLVNAPGHMIVKEKFRLSQSLGDPASTDPRFIKGCIEIERNMIFDIVQFKKDNPFFEFTTAEWEYDIPMKERVIEFEVQRDDEVIDKMYRRVKKCREHLNEIAGVNLEFA
jgi:hypothetical protein